MAQDGKALVADFKAGIRKGLNEPKRGAFIPTGLQDDIIQHVGAMAYNHYHVQSFNNLGKTCLWTVLARELAAPSGNKYFDLPLFRDWPKEWPRAIGVITTKENLKEGGAAEVERAKWWPADLHDGGEAQGQHYKSFFRWKSGWTVKLYSNEQPPNQLEGWEVGLWIMDEPARPGVVSAMNTRLKHGGIGISIFTPVTLPGGFNPGPVIDVLEDLEKNGRKIKYLNYNEITENDRDTGRPNRFNEKRGLYTKAEIDTFSSGVSTVDRDARLKGLCNIKMGRLFPDFTDYHQRHFDFTSRDFREWNCFMGMDPHPTAYPFLLWAAKTPNEQWIVYNEWPQVATLGMYYDEARKTVKNTKFQVSDIAGVIRALDCGDEEGKSGFRILGRVMDPYYTRGHAVDFGRETGGLIEQFAGQVPTLKFILPETERIFVQRNRIQELLRLANPGMPFVFGGNEPGMYVMPHCRNFIRCLQRHYEDQDGEAEEYKDPIDVLRYILSAFDKRAFLPPPPPAGDKPEQKLHLGLGEYQDLLNKPGLI